MRLTHQLFFALTRKLIHWFPGSRLLPPEKEEEDNSQIVYNDGKNDSYSTSSKSIKDYLPQQRG